MPETKETTHYGTAWRYGNASKDCITILTARSAVYIFCQIVMSNKNKNKSQQNEVKDYWREMEAERKVKDTRAKEFYEDRINDLLEMVGRGKGTRDYELQLVRIAAKNWMYLDRNRDSLRLSGAYKAKAYNPGEEENAIITESSHVKSVLRFRTILEGLFQAMGIPNRVAFECDESRIPRYQR